MDNDKNDHEEALREARRQILEENRKRGREVERLVEEKILKHVDNYEREVVIPGRRLDFEIRSKDGELIAVGEIKSGSIKDAEQIKDQIDQAEQSETKTYILAHTDPEKALEFLEKHPEVLEYAMNKGVKFIIKDLSVFESQESIREESAELKDQKQDEKLEDYVGVITEKREEERAEALTVEAQREGTEAVSRETHSEAEYKLDLDDVPIHSHPDPDSVKVSPAEREMGDPLDEPEAIEIAEGVVVDDIVPAEPVAEERFDRSGEVVDIVDVEAIEIVPAEHVVEGSFGEPGGPVDIVDVEAIEIVPEAGPTELVITADSLDDSGSVIEAPAIDHLVPAEPVTISDGGQRVEAATFEGPIEAAITPAESAVADVSGGVDALSSALEQHSGSVESAGGFGEQGWERSGGSHL